MNDIRDSGTGAPQTWLNALLHLWTLRTLRFIPGGNPWRAASIMGAAWLAAWIAIDRWQIQPDPQFFPGGMALLAWYLLAILSLAVLLRWRAQPSPAFGPVLALTMGAVPVPLLFVSVAGAYLEGSWYLTAGIAVAGYTALYLARGLHTLTGQSQRLAACFGVTIIIGFCWLSDTLDVVPDLWASRETQAAEPADATADGEALLFSQQSRIDRSLAPIGRNTSSKPEAFFLGFAGVGDQKVFAQEVGLASRVLGERYDIDGRSLSLINDERDLDRAPLASVSGLKYALRGLASRMNLDQDVLFLSISSHGAEDPAVIVSNSQLPLNDLTDQDLADALRDSGIKWRVIVISACYAGGFIDALSDAQTIVIAAAAADRTSFGCSNDRDLTYFGEAFYRDALPGAHSLREAFDTAKLAIAARETQEHVTPSKPQAYFGAKMQAKLSSMGEPRP
jgi:hypothetical protein